MATCPVCNDGKRLTAHGLKIHMGKLHGVHHDASIAATSDPLQGLASPGTRTPEGREGVPNLVPCPCLFCKVQLPAKDMREHWDRDHPTWRLYTGLYTWEV